MRRRCLCWLAIVLATSATPLRAQQVRALEERLDSLAQRARAVEARLATHDDSVRAAAARTDTIRVGALRYAVEPALVPLVRDAARHVEDTLRAVLVSAYPRTAGHTYSVRARVPENWERPGPEEIEVSVFRPSGEHWRGWRAGKSVESVRDVFIAGVLRSVFNAADPGLFRWMGDVVPRDSVPDAEWIAQRVALVSVQGSIGRDCFHGMLEACKRILALVPTTDPVLQWHDAASRRELASRNGATARRISNALALACERGSDSACVALLQQFPPQLLLSNSAVSARLSLARLAVSLGGPGALGRLLDSASSANARLSAASRLPEDTLVARWQARVRDARLPSRDFSAGIALMTAAWVTGLGALSLKSSRWR